MEDASTRIEALLTELSEGRERAADELLPLVYDELRSIADAYLRQERSDHTLLPTGLVHEAYMKMVGIERVDWSGQTHFRVVATKAMRRILIDHARSRNREKRGKGWRRVSLESALLAMEDHQIDAEALHDALEKMRELDERQTRVVELRILGDLTTREIAGALGISTRTVEREWQVGRAWLRRELGGVES